MTKVVNMPNVGRSPKQLLDLIAEHADELAGVVVLIDWGDSTQVCWSNQRTDRFTALVFHAMAEAIGVADAAWEPGSPLDGRRRDGRMTQEGE